MTLYIGLSFLLLVLMTTALSPAHAIVQLSDDYLSAWKITKATRSDNSSVTLGSGGQLALSRLDTNASSDYRLSIKVANHFTTSIHVLEEDGHNGGFKIEIDSGIAMTRMMPPPELRELERFLSESLPLFDTLRLENGASQLEFSSAESGASLVCEKIDDLEGST